MNFIFVSRKWQNFYGSWTKLEKDFRHLLIVDVKQRKTNRKICKWFYAFLTASFVSFILQLFNGTITACVDDTRDKSFDQEIFEIAYAEQFKVVPYHIVFGLYFCFVDLCCTFAWCFNDLFIMCIGIIMHRNFELLNEKFLLNASVSVMMSIIFTFESMQFETMRFSWKVIAGAVVFELKKNKSSHLGKVGFA